MLLPLEWKAVNQNYMWNMEGKNRPGVQTQLNMDYVKKINFSDHSNI